MENNYRDLLSIRGIALILLGMAGSVIGNHVLKTGVQTSNTLVYSSVLFMVCFFLILVGVIVWGFDIYQVDIGKREKESPDDSRHRQEKFSREMNVLKIALTGILLLGLVIFGVRDTQNFWIQAGIYLGVPVMAIVFYILIKSS